MSTSNIHIFVVDVGSPANDKLGWASSHGEKGGDLDECIALINKALKIGPVALGFEAPLYIPVRNELKKLSSRREFEGNRPWSAYAGPSSAMIGLAIMVYVFNRLVDGTSPTFATPKKRLDLQIFEAMVTGKQKTENDAEDAMLAVNQYSKGKLYDEGEGVLNLAAAALLRAGYEVDISQNMYIVKP